MIFACNVALNVLGFVIIDNSKIKSYEIPTMSAPYTTCVA